ncbi:MAG: response regulator [Candidatus Doudnabacteria bacterium]|nr:response regulator [Candidatus Doudnabacteria bacterium]
MSNSEKKILVVEDDNDLRRILVDGLQLSNYQILQAADGEEAINVVMDHRPHLILLDLLLPKVDGFQVLERVRTYPDRSLAETKVIILSNLWSNKDILRAQALKVDEYFVKANTKVEDVFKRVAEIINILDTQLSRPKE